MTREIAFRHIEVLCRLPLTELGLVRALCEALHGVVPSRWNVGGTFRKVGEPGPGYGEFEGYTAMCSRWQKECSPYFGEGLTIQDLAQAKRVGQTLALQKTGYEHSDVYKKVFRPFGVKWFLDVTVQDEHGVMAGLMLLRGPEDGRFTQEDCSRLETLLPCIAHGFRECRKREAAISAQPLPFAPNATDSGNVLVSHSGAVRAMTRPARRVLEMMSVEAADLDRLTEMARDFVSGIISSVLAAPAASGAIGTTSAAQGRVVNGLGEFRLSVSGLDAISLPEDIPEHYEILPHQGPPEPLRSLSIEYREPLALHLARAMRQAGLPPGQVHVGVLIAMGRSQTEVAEELGVKRSSVDDAVRKIYARTDVRSAIELAWRFAGR